MSNLADEIERFILRKLAGQEGDIVILRRNELADELACAPSQISYVLNTRFSVARGFIVESRRGLGGFVRIARVPLHTIIFEDAAKQIDVDISLHDLKGMLIHLRVNGLLTGREALLLMESFSIVYEHLSPYERVEAVRRLLRQVNATNE